jgi:hypothetical protein
MQSAEQRRHFGSMAGIIAVLFRRCRNRQSSCIAGPPAKTPSSAVRQSDDREVTPSTLCLHHARTDSRGAGGVGAPLHRSVADIEPAIAIFASEPNRGMIMMPAKCCRSGSAASGSGVTFAVMGAPLLPRLACGERVGVMGARLRGGHEESQCDSRLG